MRVLRSRNCVAAITIRKLDEETKRRLKIRAASHGRSMEEEAREILQAELSRRQGPAGNLAQAVRKRFAALGS